MVSIDDMVLSVLGLVGFMDSLWVHMMVLEVMVIEVMRIFMVGVNRMVVVEGVMVGTIEAIDEWVVVESFMVSVSMVVITMMIIEVFVSMVILSKFSWISVSWSVCMVLIMQIMRFFDVWILEIVLMVSLGWTEMRDVFTVSLVSSCPFSVVSGSPFSVVSVSMMSIQLRIDKWRFVVGSSPVFGMVRSLLMRSSPEGIMESIFVDWFETWVDVSGRGFVSLFKSMSFGSGMSERCLVVLNVTSVLSDFLMIMRVWELMWLHDKRSLMWFNDFSVRDKWGVMEIAMSIIETVVRCFMMSFSVFKSMVSFSVIESMVFSSVANIVMSKIMVFWGEMAVISSPFVSMAMIDNVI